MRIGMGIGVRKPSGITPIQRAISLLRSYGTNAHVYLPGVGVLSGLQAANYLDSAGTTQGTVDQPVGLVKDSFGANDAIQSTTPSKPVLRRGALALNPNSQNLSGWGATTATLTPAQLDPFGGTSATKITGVATAYGRFARQYNTLIASTKYTVAAVVKAGSQNYAAVRIASAANASDEYPYFDLTTGAGTNVTPVAGVNSAVSSANLGNGWWLIVLNHTTGAAPSGTTDVAMTTSTGGTTSAPLTSDNIYCHRAALFQGTYTAAQIQALGGIPLTTTAPASTALGPYWWQFDGVDDSLALSGPLFQMSDDHCVIAGGMTNDTSSVMGLFYESGAGGVPIVAGLGVSSGVARCYWRDDSGALANVTGDAITPGAAFVLSGRKTGNAKLLRQNGVAKTTVSTVLGATTITSQAIGFDSVSSGFWIGSIYPLIAIKGTVSDADLLTLERFVGNLSGVTI